MKAMTLSSVLIYEEVTGRFRVSLYVYFNRHLSNHLLFLFSELPAEEGKKFYCLFGNFDGAISWGNGFTLSASLSL